MSSVDLLNTAIADDELAPFADRLESRLTSIGGLNLLAVAIRIAPPDARLELMLAAIRDLSTGQPYTPFYSIADEATEWADIACLTERKFYLAAIWQSLPENQQSEFWKFVQRRADDD